MNHKNDKRTIKRSEEEWRQLLSDEEFRVLRQQGTEPPFKNRYHNDRNDGVYVCTACRNPLFDSRSKFDSGTGWPSFFKPLSPDAVAERDDHSLAIPRTEVTCSRCESHLGHVFADGPKPTGLRYCMNSVAMKRINRGEL